MSLIYTYINYAIRNNEDWSDVLLYTPVSEIGSMDSHSDLALAVALHQRGIAHLWKEISNRKYQLRNGSIDLGFDLDSNPLLDMGKGYLDAAQDIYDKCKLKDTKLLKKQLTSDYKLYDWLVKIQIAQTITNPIHPLLQCVYMISYQWSATNPLVYS